MSRLDVFPLPWLTTAASGSYRLKSAAAWGRKRKAEQRLRINLGQDVDFVSAKIQRAEKRRGGFDVVPLLTLADWPLSVLIAVSEPSLWCRATFLDVPG